ncbi:MAG TPA: cytochrome b/b6 domain-containing protein [Steroidobacteraceae bacterium]|nr:cytochrome b/b6 domain-containing protein [Steroidobacteraceae bacterium]
MKGGEHYVRHRWPVRAMHWINLVALTVLLSSGLQIFNAHPALYWGKSSYTGAPPVLQMRAETLPDGSSVGETVLLGKTFRTTGLFGLSKDASGDILERGFPSWLTLPSSQWLAMGRRWHFFFAWILVVNGLLYLGYSAVSGHLSRDLAPTKRDWRSVGNSIREHLLFRHPVGEAARHYNVLQKITYLTVIFGIVPFTILMGLAMSPRLDTVLSGVLTAVGGRQSARTLHFLGANLLLLFVLVHVFEVMVTGVWNNLRSMVTGRFVIPLATRSAAARSTPSTDSMQS